MAVIIRPKFNAAQIARMMAERRLRIINAIHQRLQFVGEMFVTNARNTDTYHDQTGNLRSSIGYVIYQNGALVSQNFPGAQPEGVSKARQLADEVAADYATGFVLVCVAGMEYAAAVESRGFDVITNSSITAVSDIRQGMQRLRQQINRV